MFVLAGPSGVFAIRVAKRLFSEEDLESKALVGLQLLWFLAIFVFVLVAHKYVWETYIETLFS